MKLFKGGKFAVMTGDITRLAVDAIVNPTNPELNGEFGVDAAVHAGAGPDLALACAELGPLRPGGTLITPGFGLRARAVIHVVGPVWKGGDYGEEHALSLAYDAALELAREYDVTTIAFPALATGMSAFPFETATAVALTACRVYVDEYPDVFKRITFCPFTEAGASVYLRHAARYLQ